MRVGFSALLLLLAWGPWAAAQRLPPTVVPQRYVLKLTPEFADATFSGDETIEVRLLQPTSTVVLNALDLEFQEVTITSGGITQKADATFQSARETVVLTVPKRLPSGVASIHIRFSGVLNDKLRGFYLSKAGDRQYAVTQFESTDARRAFPCFDEPGYKTVFDISVVAPVGNTAISNGRIVSDKPGPAADRHTIRFAPSPKMSTYLVAVLVGDFQCIRGGADGVPIRVCAPPGKQELGRFALQASQRFLQYYDAYFSIRYPYGKLDLIAIPDFEAGAMENTAAITFRDADLLLTEKTASLATKKEVALTVAHEMAHMWFGDLVTMAWWDDIWLNEGFATWMESKAVGAWRPEWRMEMDEQISADDAMSADSLQNTRPIRQAAETPAQINELFDAIAYNKTAAVLRMLEAYEDPKVFQRGVNDYLRAHAYANATAHDFWSAEAAASRRPVDRILSSYVSRPGVPLVSGDFRCNERDPATLTQHRFLLSRAPQSRSTGLGPTWAIPVCLKAASPGQPAAQSCVLLTEPRQSFPMAWCHPFELLNAGAYGYYRSGYSPEAIASLPLNRLTPVERLALLDNEWALVRSGRHPIGVFLGLAEKLRDERSQAVMSKLGDDLHFISDYLVSSQDRAAYELWVRNLLRPVIQELGWTPVPNGKGEKKDNGGNDDNDERRALRAAVFETLGYSGGDPQALADAGKLLRAYMKDPASVDPNLLNAVFTLAALQGDAALYDEFVARGRNAGDPETYYRYLYALADFRDPALLERTLAYALSPAVRSQDATLLIGNVMQNPDGRDLAWQFVETHWKELEAKSSLGGMAEIVHFSDAFCSATGKREVEQFFTEHPVSFATRGLQQTLEEIQNCVDFRAQQEPALKTWLKP